MAGIIANSASISMAPADTATTKSISGFVRGETITLTTSPTGSGHRWSLSRPRGSSVDRCKLSASTGTSVSFTPDCGGVFSVAVQVSGTVYRLLIDVSAFTQTSIADAIKFPPRKNSSVPTPSAGAIVFWSSTDNCLSEKHSDGVVYPVAGTGGGGNPVFDTLYSSVNAETIHTSLVDFEEFNSTLHYAPMMRFAQGPSRISLRASMPPEWDHQAVTIHLITAPLVTGTGNISLVVKGSWDLATWQSSSPTIAVGTANVAVNTVGGTITGSPTGRFLYLTIYRDHTTDTYSNQKSSGNPLANVAFLGAYVTYQKDSYGSETP